MAKFNPFDRSIDARIAKVLRSEENLRLKLAVERLIQSACDSPSPGLWAAEFCKDHKCKCHVSYERGGAYIATDDIGERRGWVDETLENYYIVEEDESDW